MKLSICSECGRRFAAKKNLKQHVKSVHQNVTFSCGKCDKQFSRASNKKRHEQKCKQQGTGQSTPSHLCSECQQTFSSVFNLNRHKLERHALVNFPCSKCRRNFARNSYRIEHESKCTGAPIYLCDICREKLGSLGALTFHRKLAHRKRSAANSGPAPKRTRQEPRDGHSVNPDPPAKFPRREPRPGPSSYKCGNCPETFENRRELYVHNMTRHFQTGGGIQREPWAEGGEPWVGDDGRVDEKLRDCYRTNAPLILQNHRPGPVESTYNVPVFPGMTAYDLGRSLIKIYERQTHAFKINLSFGFIMQHVETNEMRYFRPYDNQTVLDEPLLISDSSNLKKLIAKLTKMDVIREMSKARPDTKWRLVLLTNIRYKLYNTNFVLGAAIRLPDTSETSNANRTARSRSR